MARQPRYESPTFLRTVLGLCFLSVVLQKAERAAPTRSDQYCSAAVTSAVSWIMTVYRRRSRSTPRRSNQARKTSIMPGSLLTKMTVSRRSYGLSLVPSAQYKPTPRRNKFAVRHLSDLCGGRRFGLLPLRVPHSPFVLPALPSRKLRLLRRIAPLRHRQIPHPQRDRTLRAPQLHLDPVVRPALASEIPGLLLQVVLRVRALRPGRGRFSLHQSVEDVVVVDLQFVSDLAEAEALAAERHRLLPQPFEIGVLAWCMCHTHSVRAE